MFDQIAKSKRYIPGPSHYLKKPKPERILGTYGNKELKITVTESVICEKKDIPAPNKYESRGKSMSEILKEKAKKFNP